MYKHGLEVPRDYAHALQCDLQNGNTKWKDAIDLEIEQIKEYHVFKDHGKVTYEKGKIIKRPQTTKGSAFILCLMLSICGKFKARLVVDGHLTKETNETFYSGVVSL